MILRLSVIACTVFAVATMASLAGKAEDSEYGALHEAPGVDLTYAYCAACHSEMLVAQQGMTRERWDNVLEWMVEEQGMSEIEEPDRTIILDYLAENYNTDRPHFPRR